MKRIRRFWSGDELEILREFYPDVPTQAIADALCWRIHSVYAKAKSLGLKKSPEFLASGAAGRLDGVRGGATRFQGGHSTWNKGMKGLQIGGEATRFQPGHKPQTWRPIGAERVTKEGYLQRKVADTGNTVHDYVEVHRLLWEEHHGIIPPGLVLIFKDGDKQHIALDNLELLTRRELMARNTVHNLPPELVQVIQLRGAINRKINAKHRRAS